MDIAGIDRVSRAQHGLITTRQVLELGATYGWIRNQVARGYLVRVRKGVFRLAGVPVTQDQAWLAAVLASPGEAVLSHETAAAAWAFRGFDPPPGIDLLTTRNRTRLPGVRGHETKHLPESDRTVLRRIPITTAERSIIDCSGLLHSWVLGRVVDDALRRKIVRLPRLTRCFEGVPPSGRRASVGMEEVLQKRPEGYDPGGSAEELDVLRILREAGISPLPRQQYRLALEGRVLRPDFVWLETKHIIEYDGGYAHPYESARHDDRERWRVFVRAGFTVWPLTERTTRAEIVDIGLTATAAYHTEGGPDFPAPTRS